MRAEGRNYAGDARERQSSVSFDKRGAKSYADPAAAREEIVGTVAEKFGLVLEQEPVEMTTKDKLK